jgi:SAM-dependent methyltransferase
LILADLDSPEVAVWQLAESCGYTADLPVWTELTAGQGPVLDLGCGIGRVARHLARSGTEVVGLDFDPLLVDDLNRLSGDEPVRGVAGDATELAGVDLGLEKFEAILAPQQLLHIVGGEVSRQKLIEGVKERLETGGLAAFAISEWVPGESREVEVLPDIREIGNWVYASRPVAVEDDGDALTVVRLRQIVAPDGSFEESHDSITLDRMDRHTLAEEISEAGLAAVRTIEVPETERHIATVVVVACHADEIDQTLES